MVLDTFETGKRGGLLGHYRVEIRRINTKVAVTPPAAPGSDGTMDGRNIAEDRHGR